MLQTINRLEKDFLFINFNLKVANLMHKAGNMIKCKHTIILLSKMIVDTPSINVLGALAPPPKCVDITLRTYAYFSRTSAL